MIQLLRDATGATPGEYKQVSHGGRYTISVADSATIDGGVNITVASFDETAAASPTTMEFATKADLADAIIYLGDSESVRAEPQGASSDIPFLNLHRAG